MPCHEKLEKIDLKHFAKYNNGIYGRFTARYESSGLFLHMHLRRETNYNKSKEEKTMVKKEKAIQHYSILFSMYVGMELQKNESLRTQILGDDPKRIEAFVSL